MAYTGSAASRNIQAARPPSSVDKAGRAEQRSIRRRYHASQSCRLPRADGPRSRYSLLPRPLPPFQSSNIPASRGNPWSPNISTATARTAANGMPIPGGHVVLTLAGGKRLTLPQTLSGSGIRYANADESFVFWSKGNTAFVEEGPSQTQTYKGCVGEKKAAR